MKGNEAIAEAAIAAGCRYFFGYPITPQNQIPEYFSRRMPQVDGVYLQAESEIAAINMVYGASGAGGRVMTSSSSPGISLKQEGISYIAGARLPCVIANIMRGGPGLGGIQPSQSDYYQATRGGGNGDYRTIVLAPSTVQEAADLTYEAFDLADQFRMPVMLLGDGFLGQMMEPVELPAARELSSLPKKEWAAVGWADKSRPRASINSLHLDPVKLELHNLDLAEVYKTLPARAAHENTEDAEIVLTAYGVTARVARVAMALAREQGIKVGLVRPLTLYPFPDSEYQALASGGVCKHILVTEMSLGQMIDDVRLALNGALPVSFYGRVGGMVPTADALLDEIKKIKESL